jgi:ribosomal protein S18 acetylase RimI-like enzyme
MGAYTIRDGTKADLAALVRIRPTEPLLAQYLCDAQSGMTRFLVCAYERELVGFVELVYEVRDPRTHSEPLPRFNDLYVAPAARGRGAGTALVAALEQATLERGFDVLRCSVDPVVNHRALALYRRLGYMPVDSVPERKVETFFDAEGDVQQHVYWRIELLKYLR